MINKKSILSLAASLTIIAGAIMPAVAAGPQTQFATVNGVGVYTVKKTGSTFKFVKKTGSQNVYQYKGGTGAGNGFSVIPNSGGNYSLFNGTATDSGGGFTSDFPTTFSFTGLTNVGTLNQTGSPNDVQTLSGGTFKLQQLLLNSSTGVVTVGQTLLSGTFGTSSLKGKIGSDTGSLQTNIASIVYDAANDPYFTDSGLFNPGAFSFGLSSVTPIFALAPGGTAFRNFTATGAGSFTASDVPEPGSVAAFAFTGLGMMGLMLRARKSRGSMAS